MLVFPTKGMARSVKEHNVKLDVLCDWVEATLLFSDDRLSKSDIVDALNEEHIYANQSFALETVSNAFTELSRRQSLVSEDAPFEIDEMGRVESLRAQFARLAYRSFPYAR